MKNSTPILKKAIKFTKLILLSALSMVYTSTTAQEVMYGDTIFWENFGSGTTRADISGRGIVGGLYMYAGDLEYSIGLNSADVATYVTANSGRTWIQETPKFKEIPISTSSNPYSNKPAEGDSEPFASYWTIDSWKDWDFSSEKTDFTTATLAVDDYTAGAETSDNNYPCSWMKVDGVWKFGFYYTTYENDITDDEPNDGYYALIDSTNRLTGGATYLQDAWLDHSGLSCIDNDVTAVDPDTCTHTGNGRFMFVNCSQSNTVTGAVYKRQVTELCRDAMFEFSIWVTSVHNSTDNASFRIEIWSDDPGENPSLGSLTDAYEGLSISEANDATLILCGTTTGFDSTGYWKQIKEVFTLLDQDYCWVVVRNYGSGSGNDIGIDDLVFKPFTPFNLDIELAASVLGDAEMACNDGLVSLVSNFPENMPEYISLQEFGFYFQGQSGTNEWVNIGSTIPIQTQSAAVPLELTIPLAEYNLYDRYRITVATTPAGFGGRCITFTYPPTDKEPIGTAPEFTITGLDVCDDTNGNQTGTFIITNTNQAVTDNNWVVKLRMPDGSIVTRTPAVE